MRLAPSHATPFLPPRVFKLTASGVGRRGRHAPEHRHTVAVQVAARGAGAAHAGVRGEEEGHGAGAVQVSRAVTGRLSQCNLESEIASMKMVFLKGLFEE